MSFEYLCEHCGEGRIRPIQFSFDEAVLTCDNEDCDSRLDVSPWSCVVNRNISQVYTPASNQRHIQHWSRSSSSSSGIQSDVRSPGFSPARSCDSVTDREVENLLQRYLNARPKTTAKNLVSCPKPSNEKGTSELNNFSSFFELLDGLDLESTDQQSSKECLPLTAPSICEDIKFDPVSSELESWMKGFESPMPSHKKDSSQNFDTDHTENATIQDSLSNRLYIPSRSSAFSQVSPKNDSSQNSSSCSLVDSDAGITERNSERIVVAVEKTFEPAKNCLTSFNEAHFLSPATSIVSDDSGYDDVGSKINSVLFLPSLEKRNNPSSAVPNLGDKTTCEEQNVSSELLDSTLENSESSVPRTNILPTSALPSPCTQPSVVMNDVESSKANRDEGDSCSGSGQNDKKPAVNTSGSLCDSSQFSDSISPSKTQSSGSSELSSAETNSNSASTLQESSNNSNSSLQSKAAELCQVKPPSSRKSGRPRGRPRKDPDAEPPKRVSKRRRQMAKKKEGLPGSASLSKGLASVLQAPAFYVRKDEAHHHNITTLSFRNRLNGSFIEDPWSVPELHLEELSIEIVVQGQRDPPSSQKDIKTSNANQEETKVADSPGLHEDSSKKAVRLENKETINASSTVTDTSDGECLRPNTHIIGQSSPKDSDSHLKDGSERLGHEDCDSESEDGSSDDSSSESWATKDSETDPVVKLLVPYSDSSASNNDENSSVQRLKCLHNAENCEICDKGPSSSENNQEKFLVCDETGKQTLKNFDGALSRCSPSRSNLIDHSDTAKIKTEGNIVGDLPSRQVIEECVCADNETPKIDASVTSTCVGDEELRGDKSKLPVRDKSMELLDLPQSVSPSLLDINVKDALQCSELSPMKGIESGFDSFLDTSYELNLCNLQEVDSCVLDFASPPNIRSWMRHTESNPVVVKKEKLDTDVSETTLGICAERKIRGQSSDYFSTLLEDLDFEEEFFQCPTTENLSSTFGEHLSSSLFFGETACSSTSTSMERPLVCGTSASVPDLSSVSTTVTTVISPTSMPVLNVSCSLKSPNGTVPQSGMHTVVSIGNIPSATPASATSVTQSLHRAIASIQDIFSPPLSACGSSKDKISDDRVLNRENDALSNPQNEKVLSDVNLYAKNLIVKPKSAETLRSQNDCGKDGVLRKMSLKVKQEPTSPEDADIDETSGNSCNSKASTSAGMLDTPFISIDSDDEIQITMPNEKSLTEKSSKKSIGHNEGIPEVPRDLKVDCMAPASYPSNPPSLLPLGTSKEASHEEVVKGRKPKDMNISQRELETEDRYSFHDKTSVGKCLSGNHKGNLMCGILDNSVVHDSSCFSRNAKGFVEFEENPWSERPPENINFYFGSKRTNFKLVEDLEGNCNTLSKTPHDQLDKITLNDKHLGSPDKASMPFTFEVGSKFGCTKSSPQHKVFMSPTSEDSSIEKMAVDAQNLGFLCYDSSSETCSSSSSDGGEEEYDSETSMSDKLFSSSRKKFSLSIANPSSSSNVDLSTSFYDGSGEESETDREAFFRKRRMLDRGVLEMDSADSDSSVFKKPQMHFKRKLDSLFSSESQSELEQQRSTRMPSLSCIPAEPLKKKTAVSLHKPPIGMHRKLMSTPLHRPFIQSSEKLLSSQKLPKGLCAGTLPVNNTKNQKCIFSKSNLSKDALENGNLSREKKPLSLYLSKGNGNHKPALGPPFFQSPNSSSQLFHEGNQKQLHDPFQNLTVPCNTSIEKPSFCHSGPELSSSLPSSTNINCVASSSMTSLKSPSFIDCQMPSVTNSSVIIPPALRSSYAPVQDGTHSVFKDVGSSSKVSNMQEKLIVIKNETPNGPVMKVLRVNVIPNSTVGTQLSTGMGGSSTQQPSTSQTPKPKLNVAHVSSEALAGGGSDCSERGVTPKDSRSEETKKELLTKIRIGANGRFYVRPTFAMLNAISEMRKTKDQKSHSEDPEVDCVELPDGIPISHPFQIPDERSLKHLYKDHNKKVSRANKKRRKRKKKYILQRIQNLVKEKVQETVTRSKDEIPEMVAVFIGGKLHIYSRDADRRSAQ